MSQSNGAAKTFPSILDKLDGPQLAALKDAVFNAATTISRFALAGRSFDDRRDLKKECGYPDTVSAEEYQRLFDEEPYAARVVELWPKESWKTTPTVYEDEDAEEATEFEAAIDALGQALRTERSYHVEEEGSVLWDYLYRADVVSGIGCYGIILLGLNDGKALSEPAEPFADDPTAEGVVDRINFVRVFPEALAPISALESDPRSPRYGQPVAYSVTFSDPSELATGGAVIGLGSTTSQVHWTRVIHVADVWHLASASDWFAKPRMKNPLHSLLDIQKIRGSSGEGFWRAVVNLLSLETHPQLGGDVDINRDQLRRELENFYNGMQRDLVTSGMSVKTLAPTVTDPNPFIEANVQSICVVMNVPVPVFKGYEIGEQASQNNDTTWLARVAARNGKYVTPRLIVPLVDRLVSLRVLPEPEAGYKVAWPDNSTPKATETAAVAAQRVTAMATYVSGGVEALMAPMDFLARELKYTEEEAKEILEASAQAEEEKLAEQQALAEEQGFEMEAPEGMVDPEQREAEQEIAMEQAKAGAKAGPPGKKGGPPPFVKNVFCPTGEGGGVDPTCSPKETGDGSDGEEKKGGLSEKRQRAIEEQASRIPVTDEMILTERVDERDYEAIQERMTREEHNEMDNYFNESARRWAEESADEQDFDIRRQDVLDEAGLSEEDFESSPEVAQREYEKAEQALLDRLREDYISDYERNYSPDTSERHEYLRQFYNDRRDDPRFAGATDVLDKWGVGDNGRSVMLFETSAGDRYKIQSGIGFSSDQIKQSLGVPVETIEFSDPDGSYGVTGRGNAKEVFSKVTAATVAYVKANPDKAFYFTAEEESRQSLYEKLVKTTAKVVPGMAAVAVKTPGKYTMFIIGPRDSIHKGVARVADGLKKYNYRTDLYEKPEVDVIVNQDVTVTFLRPMIDPSWFPEE